MVRATLWDRLWNSFYPKFDSLGKEQTLDPDNSVDVSDVYMVLAGILDGTFHIIKVHYKVSSDTESSIVTKSREGNVSLLDCN
jgi:hypothetical protein